MRALRTLLRDIRHELLRGALRAMGARRRRIVAWRSMSTSGVQFVTFERDGIVWRVSPHDDVVGFHLFVDGGYHRHEIRALLEWMRRWGVLSGSRSVIVDVGANIGSTCVALVRETGGRALAIEPVAENFDTLEVNVAANGLADRILLAKKAVVRDPGRVTMCLTRGASGGNFVWRDGLADVAPGDLAGYEDVEADTLAAIVASAGLRAEEVALVWADVQGCEADVIESGAGLWELGVPLWAEVEPHSLTRQASLATFVAVAGRHFDRFIESRALVRFGADAPQVSIGELERLIRELTPQQLNTDVLFLPPRFSPRAPRAAQTSE